MRSRSRMLTVMGLTVLDVEVGDPARPWGSGELRVVFVTDAAKELDRIGLLGIPVRDLLDQAPALALRCRKRGDQPLPLVLAADRLGVDGRHLAEAGDDAVAEPPGVTILEGGQPAERGRHLRVACPLGVLAQEDGMLRLGAVVLD